MHEPGTLVIIGIAAFLLPPVAARILVPAVVLEILFGVLAGPVLGLVETSELLDQIGDLGLLMLMFLAGFEIDFAALRRGGARSIAQALTVFAATLSLSFLATWILDLSIFYGPVLATTSAALVLPSMRSAGITGKSLGQAILVAAVVADLVTLLLVAEITIWARDGWGIALIGGPALLLLVVFTLRVLKLLVWWHPERASRLFEEDDPDEMGIRGALALLLVLVGVSAALQVEPILAAFLAGGVFALLFQPPTALRRQLSGISWGFLIPIFFINVGLRFDVAALTDPGLLRRAGVILLAALLVKFLPAMLYLFWGFSLRAASAAGFLLSARLSLVVAVATVGMELGLLTQQDRAIAVVIAAATSITCPILFRTVISHGTAAAASGEDGADSPARPAVEARV